MHIQAYMHSSTIDIFSLLYALRLQSLQRNILTELVTFTAAILELSPYQPARCSSEWDFNRACFLRLSAHFLVLVVVIVVANAKVKVTIVQ